MGYLASFSSSKLIEAAAAGHLGDESAVDNMLSAEEVSELESKD